MENGLVAIKHEGECGSKKKVYILVANKFNMREPCGD